MPQSEYTQGQIYNVTDGKHYSRRDIYNALCLTLGKKIPRWAIPVLIFRLVGSISPSFKKKVEKLLVDECYSSEKLENLGFSAKRQLFDNSSW